MADENRTQGTAKRDMTCLMWVLGGFGCTGIVVLAVFLTLAYQNGRDFNCRSKQSEAKANLSGLFTAEKAFFGEYESYSTDLESVNWMPDGRPIYVYGFARPSHEYEKELRAVIPNYDPARIATDDPRVIGSPPRYDISRMVQLQLNRSLIPADAVLTQTSFKAAAVGNLDQDATLDIWVIDDTKTLTNLVSDCFK